MRTNKPIRTALREALLVVIGIAVLAFPIFGDAQSFTGTGFGASSAGGGGISQASADARYLKLDASNDPLTGALSLSDGSSAAPSLRFTTGLMGFWTDGSLVNLGPAGGSARVSFPPATGAYSDYSLMGGTGLAISSDGGYTFTSNANRLSSLGLIFGTAQSTRASVLSTYSNVDADVPGGGIQLYSAMDGTGSVEYAAAVGTSASAAAITSNQLVLLSIAADVDGTPSRKVNIWDDGHIEAGAGTAALPTYSFMGDPDTGVYNSAADALGIAANGANVGTFDTAGLLLPAGLVGTPSLQFDSPTADIGFHTGDSSGTSYLSISREGAPSSIVDFGSGAGAYTTFRTSYFQTSGGVMWMDSNAGLRFESGAAFPAIVGAATVNTAATSRANGGLIYTSAMDNSGEYAHAMGTLTDTPDDLVLLSLGDLVSSAGTMNRKINFFGGGYMQAGAGTVALPTYSFIGDPDTGVYNTSDGLLDFSSNGSREAYVNQYGITSVKASGGGFQGFLAEHAGSGTDQYVGFSANTNTSNYSEFYATGSTYTASTTIPQNGGYLGNNGPGGLNIVSSNAATPAIRFMLDTPAVTLMTLDAAVGVLPGSDLTFALGSDTLSWKGLYTNNIYDSAGTNRMLTSELGATALRSTTPASGGVDIGFSMTVTGDLLDDDYVFVLYDDSAGTIDNLFAVEGNGQLRTLAGTAALPTLTVQSDERTGLFFPSSAAIGFSQQGVEIGRFDSGGLTISSTNDGVSITGGGHFVVGTRGSLNTASTAGDLRLYSGADASTEIGVRIGTSDATGSGEYLASFCLDCDGTPSEVARVESDGDIQADGVVRGDGGVQIGGGTTITKSSNVSTASVDFASISADTCGEKTATLSGASVNDPVACAWPASIEAGLMAFCYISAVDTVTYRLCNVTAVSIDPAAATFGARTLSGP